MSMNNWPEYGFGLMLNEEESKRFCKKYSEVEKDNKDVYDVEADIDCCRYYSDEFDGRNFWGANGNINDEWITGLFFYADRQPGAFTTAYLNMDICICEFKEKIGQYMPDDFNWEDHIGYFSASIYC